MSHLLPGVDNDRRGSSVAGSVLTDQESEFLFYFWDSMAGQREPAGA